jgi:small basic protein (TIGR04137 family)
MKRYERIDVLRAEGRIPEEKVAGLPKTKPVEV